MCRAHLSVFKCIAKDKANNSITRFIFRDTLAHVCHENTYKAVYPALFVIAKNWEKQTRNGMDAELLV